MSHRLVPTYIDELLGGIFEPLKPNVYWSEGILIIELKGKKDKLGMSLNVPEELNTFDEFQAVSNEIVRGFEREIIKRGIDTL